MPGGHFQASMVPHFEVGKADSGQTVGSRMWSPGSVPLPRPLSFRARLTEFETTSGAGPEGEGEAGLWAAYGNA